MGKMKHVQEAMVIGAKVRKARQAASMTQVQLAGASGTDVAIVSRLERGCHSPTLWTLNRIARGLGVPVGRLLP